MKGKYQSGYILPKNTKKILGDDGWDFETYTYLSEQIKKSLIKSLGLKYLESYLGIDVYTNKNIKMLVTHDGNKFIEFINFQIYEDNLNDLKSKLKSNTWYDDVELFIPSEVNS